MIRFILGSLEKLGDAITDFFKRIYDKISLPARRIYTLIKSRRSGIYYIGGAEILPPPLTRDEENEMIARLGAEDSARQTLIEHNLRLVVYIAKRFENTGAGLEDLVSIGTIGLIKGIGTFDPDKGARLTTYAARCVENAILSPRVL